MLSSVRNAFWLAQRPPFWPHAIALAARKLSGGGSSSEADRTAARAWATERAVDVQTALTKLGLLAAGAAVPEIDPAVLAAGEARAAQSGVKMGGPGAVDLIYAVTALARPGRTVETGVAYGWSTLAILTALGGSDGKLVSVDMPYPGEGNEPFVGIVVPAELRDRWTLVRLPDRPGLKRAFDVFGGEVDFVHYDSDKSYAGRMYAYPLIWQALRSGGIFMSDDIHDNAGFKDFMAKIGADYVVAKSGKNFAGIAIKP